MTNKEYRAILSRLPIKNPTPEDMAMLCPHLTKKKAIAAFSKGSGYVACPSLRIRNAFQIVSLSKEWEDKLTVARVKSGEIDASVTGIKIHPARLNWSYAGRTRKSYVGCKKQGGGFHPYPHMSEAIQFSNENWGNELILDNWVDVIEFYIQDPTDLYQEGPGRGSPKTKVVVYIGLNRPWNDLINDCSKPQTALIDEAISEMTLDPVVGQEIMGGRGIFSKYNCAYCCHGLGLNSCSGCGHQFKDDQGRTGGGSPLPPKIVKFLRDNGHIFKKDPKIAWQEEARRHESIMRQVAACQC